MKNWTATMILAALEITAVRRSGEFGHRLGKWSEAKHKMGKEAKKASCQQCGKQVVLTPYGYGNAKNKAAQKSPGIRGEAVFEPCKKPSELPSDSEMRVGRLL